MMWVSMPNSSFCKISTFFFFCLPAGIMLTAITTTLFPATAMALACSRINMPLVGAALVGYQQERKRTFIFSLFKDRSVHGIKMGSMETINIVVFMQLRHILHFFQFRKAV